MKIQIASDLHFEFPQNTELLKGDLIKPCGDVLILAGDIVANPLSEDAQKFYDKIESEFDQIIEVFGNHEFYGWEIGSSYPMFLNQLNNRTQVNNLSVILEDVKFICSTLWSHVPKKDVEKMERGLPDYDWIRKTNESDELINVKLTNHCNKISVEFLEKELNDGFFGKIVVVSHHLPSYACISKQYEGFPLNSGFANKLDDLIERNKIDLWIHGHSHDFRDQYIKGTRVVRNPFGNVRRGEHHDFKKDFVIEL